MLVLDSTLGCIEASESEVLDLYRSAPVLRSSGPGAKPESLEAYLCSIKKKTQVKVYLAFVADDRRIYVFTKPGKGDSEGEHQQTVQQALDLARNMGFSPQQVDLSYSSAMREVVIRNTKILRPPGSKAGSFLKHGAPGAPMLPLAKAPGAEKVATASAVLAAQVAANAIPAAAEAVPDTAATAKAGLDLQMMAAERDALSAQLQQLSSQKESSAQELARNRDELAGLTAERDALSAQLQQISLQQETSAQELTRTKGEVAAVTAERDALSAQLQQLSLQQESSAQELARTKGEAAAVAADRDALSAQLQQISTQQETAVQELARTRDGLGRVAAERDLLSSELQQLSMRQQESAEKLSRLREEVARLASEKGGLSPQASLEDLRQKIEELAAARGECERMTAERDALLPLKKRLKEADADRAALNGKLRELEARHEEAVAEIAKAREELAKAMAERDAPARTPQGAGSSAAELATVPPDAAKPSSCAESARWSSPEPERENAAVAEIRAETAAQPPELPAEHEAPRSCADQELPLASTLPGLLLPFPESQPGEEKIKPPRGSGSQPMEFTPLAELSEFFPAADDDSPCRFFLEKGLTAVAYRTPEEVVELYQSINNAYLSPEGKGQENCRGYICCFGNGDSRRVIAAIFGVQSGRTRIYLPEDQPEDEASYARTLRGAISFAEEVGLMMEPVQLGTSAEQQAECLKRCPVLQKVEQN